MPEPPMRDEFRRELRARLMTEAQTVLAPKRHENVWTSWLRPALAVTMAVLVLFAGAGTAAADSLPGDPAYGLKRAFEDIQVALTFDDVEKVKVLADLTDKRLAELQQVAEAKPEKAPSASEEYEQAVTRFRSAVDALREAAPADKRERAQDVADAARDKHDAIVDEIKDKLPEKAKAPVQRAIERERRDNDKDRDERNKGKDKERPNAPTRSPGGPTPNVRTTAPTGAPERTATPRPSTPRPNGTPRPTEKSD